MRRRRKSARAYQKHIWPEIAKIPKLRGAVINQDHEEALRLDRYEEQKRSVYRGSMATAHKETKAKKRRAEDALELKGVRVFRGVAEAIRGDHK